MWAQRTPQEAHDVLALPDVTVTNLKDKAFFLPKLLEMNNEVKAHFAMPTATRQLQQAEQLLTV